MSERTQIEINEWEIENFSNIKKWVKDFEENSITFVMNDDSENTFKIINHE